MNELKEKKPEGGYKITKLVLIESNFKRAKSVSLDPSLPKNQAVNIDVDCQLDENKVFVTETLTYKQQGAKGVEIAASIKMLGVFEVYGTIPVPLEEFGRVNGAAIIFPYIRETLTSLCAKASVGLVILPPFNFVKRNLESKALVTNTPTKPKKIKK